jgi:16S rRNA processing protein RimM
MVTIGKIVRVHGVCGELKVISLSDAPRRFEELERVTVTGQTGGRREFAVRASRKTADGYLIAFEGLGTLDAAASLVGGLLQISQERVAPLPEGQYYECDLMGMDVRTEEGTLLGAITEILPTGSNAVFVVRESEGVEHLIPGTKEVVRTVDVPERRMTVRRVAGLLEEQIT